MTRRYTADMPYTGWQNIPWKVPEVWLFTTVADYEADGMGDNRYEAMIQRRQVTAYPRKSLTLRSQATGGPVAECDQ